MKKQIIALLLISMSLSSCFIFRPQKMQVVGKVALSTVYANVLTQFQDAQKQISALDAGNGTVTLTEADVAFDNVITDAADGSLSLLIFKAGYTYTKKKETTVTYSLTAAAPVPAPQNSHSTALTKLIVDSYKQFKAVNVPHDFGTFDKDVEIDIAFTVDQSGSIEISGPIKSFTPDATLSRDVANTHTITIKYGIDKPAKKQ